MCLAIQRFDQTFNIGRPLLQPCYLFPSGIAVVATPAKMCSTQQIIFLCSTGERSPRKHWSTFYTLSKSSKLCGETTPCSSWFYFCFEHFDIISVVWKVKSLENQRYVLHEKSLFGKDLTFCLFILVQVNVICIWIGVGNFISSQELFRASFHTCLMMLLWYCYYFLLSQ